MGLPKKPIYPGFWALTMSITPSNDKLSKSDVEMRSRDNRGWRQIGQCWNDIVGIWPHTVTAIGVVYVPGLNVLDQLNICKAVIRRMPARATRLCPDKLCLSPPAHDRCRLWQMIPVAYRGLAYLGGERLQPTIECAKVMHLECKVSCSGDGLLSVFFQASMQSRLA